MIRQEDLRSTLVRTTVDLIDAGEGEISLRSVARASGVSAMAPYRHFADKAALLSAAADHGFSELHDLLDAADRRGGGRAALVEQGLAYVGFAQRRPNLFRLMFASEKAASGPIEIDHKAYSVLAKRVMSTVSSQQDAWMLGCWAIVHGLAMLTLDARIVVPSSRMRETLTLLLHADPTPSAGVD